MVPHQPVWNPVLTSWPHFHKDIQQITGIVRNPFMLLFLTDRQQLVKLGKYTSNTCKISTGAPQGCILSPLHFSLYTTDCTSKDLSVELLKFADDTTLIGLIQDGEDSAYAYRQEVKELAVWCSLTTWSGTRSKQWRWSWTSGDLPCSPPTYHHERLWLQWSHSDSWAPPSPRTWSGTIIDPIVKKAQQRLYFLSQLRNFNLPQELLKQFYSAIIESVLCTSITVWFS